MMTDWGAGKEAPIPECFRLANKIVAQFMEGRCPFLPPLAD